MLAAAALVPSAPLLLPEVTPALPPQLEDLRAALRAALRGLADHDVTVLLAAGDRSAVRSSAHADLTGIGRPDVSGDLPVPARAARAVADGCELPLERGALPLDLAVLALHLEQPVLPVTVDATADGRRIAALGAALTGALSEAGARAAVVGAGDGSASLGAKSPRPGVDGAQRWQAAYEAAIGDVDALSALGPGEAARVWARGWAPAVAVSAACAAGGLALQPTVSAAPRGVGYVVAATAG